MDKYMKESSKMMLNMGRGMRNTNLESNLSENFAKESD